MKHDPDRSVFITARQVAQLLEFETTQQFRSRRDHLIRDLGFPRPVPFIRKPMKWRRDDVENWIAALNRPLANGALPFHAADHRKVVLLEQARDARP